MIIKDTFKVASWKQSDIGGLLAGEPVMQVSAVFESENKIRGKFLVEYLMHYMRQNSGDVHDTDASYTGYIVFNGEILGKTGKFTLQDGGAYSAAGPKSEFVIIAASGSGDFAGISGKGKYYAENGEMVIEIDCSI